MRSIIKKPSLIARIKIAYYKLISERRRYLRVPLRVKVTITRTGLFEHFASTNISVGGMFLRAESSYAVGTHIKLEFPLPTATKILQAEGKVVRVITPELGDTIRSASGGVSPNLNPSCGGVDPGMGVQFTRLGDTDREAIERYIAQTRQQR